MLTPAFDWKKREVMVEIEGLKAKSLEIILIHYGH